MKALMKAGSLLALLAIMISSCSVEYKNRHGRHNVIDVGMNKNKLQNSQASISADENNSIVPVTGK